MNRRNFFTAMGIFISFAIAIGGWIITSRLMDIRSDMLMTTTGVTPIAMPVAAQPPLGDTDENIYVRPLLTEDEIASILQNWEAIGREIPHEPTAEQITMEEAINIAQDWLNLISVEFQLFGYMDYFESPTARLSQNQQRGGPPFLPPSYSYWTVQFNSPLMRATMIINAVEGQVWKTEISANPWFYDTIYLGEHHELVIAPPIAATAWPLPAYYGIHRYAVMNMLDFFMATIGIPQYEQNQGYAHPNGIKFSRNFADDTAYAAVHITGSQLDRDHWVVVGFNMYLGVVRE